MQKYLKTQNRCRGVVLTSEGLQKLQNARRQSEFNNNFGKRYTLEEISRLTSLDILTIRKVLNCQKGVDKRTLEYLFAAFNIDFHESDYLNSNSNISQDWGDAVCVSGFYGRKEEISILEKWLLKDQCRLMAILGIGGVGKTSLSIKFAQQMSDKFDYTIVRSLKDAPSLNTLLADICQFIAGVEEKKIQYLENVNEQISLLINYFKERRCLVILDNVETLLRSGSRAGQYIAGYEEYGEFFQRIGEFEHQSCLLITAREKPKEVALMEGKSLPVRVFQLNGLGKSESKEILKTKGLEGSEDEFNSLTKLYGGNALALKIVASTIQDLFNGCVSIFLEYKMIVFGDIRDLLAQHFERLSSLEKNILYWLTINREPVSIAELYNDLIFPIPKFNLLETLESLKRRFLIEQSNECFTLQPILMDYLTSMLVEQTCEEIIKQELWLLHNYSLIKVTAKTYIRDTQIRVILQPLTHKLLIAFKGKHFLEKQLFEILTKLRETSSSEMGYLGGNILNLLCYLGTDLRGSDFSSLTIWQANLQNLNLQRANFHSTNLEQSSFPQTFSGIVCVAFSPKGNFIAGGDTNGNIHLWEVSNGKRIFILQEHTSWVVSLSFSPDGNTLVSGSNDCTIKLWDININQCLQTWKEHASEVRSVTFSPDGELVASGSDDHTLRLWRVSTGKCLRIFRGHTSWVTTVAFTPDGKMLLSGSDDHTIKLWNMDTGELLRTYQAHYDEVRSISLSPNGQTLASGSDDHTLKS